MDELDLGATIKGFLPGQKVLGRYTLRRILGRGGMGIVWLAQDEELERELALKFLPEVVATDKEAIRDLKRETRRSLQLTHPHIIRIYDLVQDARTAAIAMEYVPGETLAARKLDQPHGHFEVEDIRAWTEQLLEALDYAHRRAQIVHRDLKPANLMIDGRGFLKVADFGIAASVSDSVSRVSAQAGSSGTPLYMSPQQMLGGQPAVTDDIYAVGATLYELLVGKPPFYSGNVLLQVQQKVAPSIAERRRELGASGGAIPPAWESAIAACLAKEAADRPQSASELAERLRGMAVPAAARREAPVESPPTPVPVQPPRKSRVGLWTGIAAAAVIAVAATWFLALRPKESAGTEQSTGGSASVTGTGGIVVRTRPEGAEVRVGSLAVQRSPATLKEVPAGRHAVVIRLDGHEEWTGSVEVKAGVFADVEVSLERSMGTLSVSADEGTAIELRRNDAPAETAQSAQSQFIQNVPVGTYQVTLRRRGWSDRVRTLTVARGATANLVERFDDHAGEPNWLRTADTTAVAAAAESGWGEAMLQLGDRRFLGDRAPVDFAAALQWYDRARELQVPGARPRLVMLAERASVGPHTPETLDAWLTEAIQAGEPGAVLIWAARFNNGWGIEPVPRERLAGAVRALESAAEAGDRWAARQLASYLIGGDDAPDVAAGARWAQRAWDAGVKLAAYELGFAAWNGRGVDVDEKAAVQWYERGAAAGDTVAMTGYGTHLLVGRGVAKDEARGLELLRRAAELGAPIAMDSLGLAYGNGTGVRKDEAEAFAWWRRAADRGYPSSLGRVGVALAHGRGVAADPAAAIQWWRRAAARGNVDAMGQLGSAYSKGQGVAADDAEALRWWREAASRNDVAAGSNVGWAYAHGRGVPEDDVEALRWWRVAAEEGDAYSMAQIGDAHAFGRGVAKDEAEAVKWWRRAAELGHADALDSLGTAYAHGRGVARDDVEALKLWRQAAAKNHPWALLNLGNAYADGRGVAKNPTEAAVFWRRAARLGNEAAQKRLTERGLSW